MKLSEFYALLRPRLVEAVGPEPDGGDLPVIRPDSRQVRPGDGFLALPGVSRHGAEFVGDALSRGAVLVLTDRLTPADLQGGTFTVNNVGVFGSILSVPNIPKGTTAILGFEAIVQRVVPTEDDAIAIRHIGVLDMSWDHRAIDGAEAARFLARLKERIETTDFSSELQQYL